MTPHYTHHLHFYPDVLKMCLMDAISRTEEGFVIDVRMWVQRWPDNRCGFETPRDPELTEGEILAPTVVVKFSRTLRHVYHDGRFAYTVKGQTSVQYYDQVRSRRLPGVADGGRSYLTV